MLRQTVTTITIVFGLIALSSCSTPSFLSNQFTNNNSSLETGTPVSTQNFPNNPIFWQGSAPTVWSRLQNISSNQLKMAVTTDNTIDAWLKLALISKQSSTDNNQLLTQLIAWRAANPTHPGNQLIPDNSTLNNLLTLTPPQRITLMLPLTGSLASSGQAVRDGFLSAYYSGLAKNPKQQVSFVDTNSNPNIATLYQQALSQGANIVVGPLTKQQVQELLKVGNFPIPTLALNYTDLWFGSLPTNFYEFGLSPTDESQQVAEKAWSEGHRRALLIAPQDAWGQRVSRSLISRWQTLGGKISDTLYFTNQTDFNANIASLLRVNPNETNSLQNATNFRQKRRQDFDVIFLLTNPTNGRQIVPLLRYYYADNIPIYATSSIYSGTPSPQRDTDLNGVHFVDTPWTIRMSGNANRLSAVGRDAYTLSSQLPRLSKLPNFPIYGASGALTLTPQGLVYRKLPWAQIRDGHP